jgi:HlyD family secretion protein
MKKYFIPAIVSSAILVVGFIVYRYFFTKTEPETVVITNEVTMGELITEVTATGTVEPVDQVDVGTQVSGLVEKIYVDYNSVVKKGQLLAELDKTNLNESVANAQAAYNSAQSQLNFQQQNYDRQKKMYQAEVISKADFESAEYQLQNAKADLAQRQTALSQARTNLSYANIYSPIDGVILAKEVEEGQTVAASMSAPILFTIAKDITKMQVEANVDEADIGEVTEGQRVSFTVDAFPELEFSGRVKQVRLGAVTTSNVVTYTVIVDADNPDHKLKPGLTATIAIYTKELKNIISIPAQALNFSPDSSLLLSYYKKNGITKQLPVSKGAVGNTVWVQKADGTLERKSIAIGEKDGVNVQVISGLNVGEKVVMTISEVQQEQSSETEKSGDSPFMPKLNKKGKKSLPASLPQK